MGMSRGCTDDGEQCGIYAIGTRRDDAELPAFFTTIEQEATCILEAVAIHDPARDMFAGHGRAIRRDDEGDFALRHDGDGHFDEAVLPGPIAMVQSLAPVYPPW